MSRVHSEWTIQPLRQFPYLNTRNAPREVFIALVALSLFIGISSIRIRAAVGGTCSKTSGARLLYLHLQPDSRHSSRELAEKGTQINGICIDCLKIYGNEINIKLLMLGLT